MFKTMNVRGKSSTSNSQQQQQEGFEAWRGHCWVYSVHNRSTHHARQAEYSHESPKTKINNLLLRNRPDFFRACLEGLGLGEESCWV